MLKLRDRSFLFNLFSLARFSHAKKYLLKALTQKPSPYESFVLANDKSRALNIWALQQVKHRTAHFRDDLFFWQLGGEEWLGNLDHIYGLYEYLTGAFESLYAVDVKGKTVLDVGAYIGDTARFFAKRGAEKLILFEPVPLNLLALEHNTRTLPVEIVSKGIAKESGKSTITSNYPQGHVGFGSSGEKYTLEIESLSFSALLERYRADVAKIDCEGAERFLLSVDGEQLKKIPYWMIEIHEHALIAPLEEQFSSAGFSVEKKSVERGHLPIFHFYQ